MRRKFSWPDDRVIRAAQDGDQASLIAVVLESHPHVQRFASSLCASPEDAEDAAQEALIILYRKIGTLRATGALASWMFRIVRNECLRRVQPIGRQTEEPGPSTAPSAEDVTLLRAEAQRVAAALDRLPVDERRVLIMRDVQGYPGPVVARSLGLSTAAMKSRLHRARAGLRQSLASTGEVTEGEDHS